MEALDAHRESVILVGAQAIYLHTGQAPVALAEATKDSDLALDLRGLADDPLVEEAMVRGGFDRDPNGQPGAWLSPRGVPVDLMVPERIAGRGSRSVTMPPHDRRAARRTRGLEGALVDNAVLIVSALDPADARSAEIRVAGPAGLLVAKLHKLGERAYAAGAAQPESTRLRDKDAHDIYRILVAIRTSELAASFCATLEDELSAEVASEALDYLELLFAAGPQAVGAAMAGRAELLAGDPQQVAVSAAALAEDLVSAIRGGQRPA
ncbi:Nucleotidyltransferase AbiEii toxin of type IV toxin-antitoxin system [Plantibacter sp. RU18]